MVSECPYFGRRVTGLPAIFGANPVYLTGWGVQDEDLLFAQDASPPRQLAQERDLRLTAQGEALREWPIATFAVRRFLARI